MRVSRPEYGYKRICCVVRTEEVILKMHLRRVEVNGISPNQSGNGKESPKSYDTEIVSI